MPVTEVLNALGSWEIDLAENTPDDVMARIGFFGHLVIIDGPVDVQASGDSLLAGARYVGVCRGVGKPGRFTRDGEGLLFWLADEDGKGHYIETKITLTNATLAQAITALLPPTVTLGTVNTQPDPAQRYTNTHQFQSRREALGVVCDTFGVELVVRNTFSVDVGTAAQLYDVTLPLAGRPSPIIKRHGTGSDIDAVAVGGQVQTEGSARDYSTRVLVLGQTVGTGDQPDTVFATGSANAPSVPYKDPQGAAVKLTRVISQSGETEGSSQVVAQLNLNRFNRTTSAVKVTADDYDVEGNFRAGDAVYVYDPDSGIVDAANQVSFHGEVIHPAVVRVSSDTWPIVEGYTVAWRTDAGVWIDITRWVVWEAGQTSALVVGDLPRTLVRGSGNPVLDRVDASRPSTKTPKTPTGLALSTSSAINPKGVDSAVITATWDPVTQNVDNTPVSLSHYEVQYRPAFRSPLWLASSVSADTSVDLPVVAALGYDVHVRAVSTGGVASAWTATAAITSAADSTAPGTPSDPVVSSYYGQLKIVWDGLSSVGGVMPADFNRTDVHVSASSGFTPSTSTLVSSLATKGEAYATAPYGATRYVKLIAYDHNGNPSPASAQVSGATVQVADGDIATLGVGKLVSGTVSADVVMAGRIATALTGARREINAVGFQAWDASNNLTISLDGIDNLLTGRLRTALSGRRVDIGAAGIAGDVLFISPDGVTGRVRSFTATTGDIGGEAIQMAMPIANTHSSWNAMQLELDEEAYLSSGVVAVRVGGNGTGSKFFSLEFASNRGVLGGAEPTLTRRYFVDATTHRLNDASGALRYYIDGTSHRWWDGGNVERLSIFSSYSEVKAPNGSTRHTVADASIENHIGADATEGVLKVVSHAAAISAFARSPLLKFQTSAVSGGGFYAAHLKYVIEVGGTSGRFQFTNGADNAVTSIEAANVTFPSTRDGKQNIQPLARGALGKVRSVRPTTYQRKGGQDRIVIDEDGKEISRQQIPDTHDQVGLIAEEVYAVAPEVTTDEGKAIDGYGMMSTLWAGLGEAGDEIEAVRASVAELRTLVEQRRKVQP